MACIRGGVEVGEADPVVLRLAREDQPLDLAVVVVGVEDHELVAVGVAREVTHARPRLQVVLLLPHALELRREALVAVVALDDAAPFLALLTAPAPVELEEHVAVEVGVDLVEVHSSRARPRTGARGSGCRLAGRSAPVIRGRRPCPPAPGVAQLLVPSRIFATSESRAASSTSASTVSSPANASLQ